MISRSQSRLLIPLSDIAREHRHPMAPGNMQTFNQPTSPVPHRRDGCSSISGRSFVFDFGTSIRSLTWAPSAASISTSGRFPGERNVVNVALRRQIGRTP